MERRSLSKSLAWCAFVVASAHAMVDAQPMAAPPSGELPAGHPPVGDDPHAGVAGAPGLPRRAPSEAAPDRSVPVGQIRVRVVDAREAPVAGAEVQVGTMSQESGRTTLAGRSDASGVAVFDKLMTGDRLAYRVNVLHDGAKFSSMPFRLPSDQGYAVVIRRLDTTHDDREIVQYVGATSIELKDERLKVVQQARVFNVGQKTYVFPPEGLLVPLPPGAMAFQAEEVMTDQKLSHEAGQGFRIRGSLPPGEVTLTWGFDLPRSGSSAELSFPLPWPTFAYRVLADAADGLSLAADGMPAAQLHDDGGHRYLVTEMMKSPGESPLTTMRIRLSGIPGPGPLRWVALGLSLSLLCGGLVLTLRARKAGSSAPVVKADFSEQKAALLSRAKALRAEHERGEIGPEFHAESMAALEEELAALLYEEHRAHSG